MASIGVAAVTTSTSQKLSLLSHTLLLGLLYLDSLLLLLSLITCVLAELHDLPVHSLDARCESLSIVFELFKADL